MDKEVHRYGLLEVLTLWETRASKLPREAGGHGQRPILVFPKGHDVLGVSHCLPPVCHQHLTPLQYSCTRPCTHTAVCTWLL